MDAPQGPYLLVAALCEKVLTENDRVNSLIRMVDRITHTEAGPDAPEAMPVVKFPLILFVNLKPGRALGRYEIALRLIAPNGQATEVGRLPVQFQGPEDAGTSFRLNIDAEYQMEGLYWFEVYWERIEDAQLMTRVPLRVVYNRTTAALRPA